VKRGLLCAVFCLLAAASVYPQKLPTVPPTYLQDQLALHVQRMIDAGHLAPGLAYVSDHYVYDTAPDGKTSAYYQFDDYWHNPAETVYTLASALPYLPAGMQAAAKAYLQSEFNSYPPYTYIHSGPGGARRELSGLPPSFSLTFPGFSFNPATYYFTYGVMDYPRENSEGMLGWSFNPYNIYACWKYAQVFPSQAAAIMSQVRNKVRALPTDDSYLQQRPHVLNQYIAGYYGYLALQQLAGEAQSGTVQGYLTTALQKRLTHLNSVDPLTLDGWEQGGFVYVVPELADYLRTNARSRVEQVFAVWNWAQPYWHIPAAGECFIYLDAEKVQPWVEGAAQDVYGHWAMFQAAANALKWNRSQLEKYLNGAAVYRGDLYYIQILVATLKANSALAPQPPTNVRIIR